MMNTVCCCGSHLQPVSAIQGVDKLQHSIVFSYNSHACSCVAFACTLQYYVTGNLTRDIYAPDCRFKDPTTDVKGGFCCAAAAEAEPRSLVGLLSSDGESRERKLHSKNLA
jgi:hypothetical protein